MTDKIWFTKDITNIEKPKLPVNKKVVRLHEGNYRLWIPIIEQSINNFNSEHIWNDMWSIDDAVIRFKENIFLYMFMNESEPLGHIWMDKNYMYNVFMSNRRTKGDTEKFVKSILYDIKRYTNEEIILYVDSWNERAIKLFTKVGFIKSNKLFTNVMNSFLNKKI